MADTNFPCPKCGSNSGHLMGCLYPTLLKQATDLWPFLIPHFRTLIRDVVEEILAEKSGANKEDKNIRSEAMLLLGELRNRLRDIEKICLEVLGRKVAEAEIGCSPATFTPLSRQ